MKSFIVVQTGIFSFKKIITTIEKEKDGNGLSADKRTFGECQNDIDQEQAVTTTCKQNANNRLSASGVYASPIFPLFAFSLGTRRRW